MTDEQEVRVFWNVIDITDGVISGHNIVNDKEGRSFCKKCGEEITFDNLGDHPHIYEGMTL